MRKSTTKNLSRRLPAVVLATLRSDSGAFDRVARRCRVSRSHVSKVAGGRRRSLRVQYALIREALHVVRVQEARRHAQLQRSLAAMGEPE